MKFYHYTTKEILPLILASGIKPGSTTGNGEKIAAVLLESSEYTPTVGNNAYLVAEIDASDPQLHQINDRWFEYYGTIPARAIVAVANPPATNGEVIAIYNAGGTAALDIAFSYQPIVN